MQLKRRQARSRESWTGFSFSGIAVIVCTLLFSGYALWNAQHTQVIRQKISMPHLSKPIKIMQFTDVHLGYYWGKNTLQKLVDLTLKEDVDAVVITGDLFDGRIRLSNETIEPLKHLKVPVYFVQGNHDGYTGALEIKAMLRQNGIIVLSNQVAHLGELQIVGLDYMIPDENSRDMMHAPTNGKTMKSVLPSLGIDRDKPALLLHHNPIGVEYAKAAGIDLYLAGHTHSGQFYPLIWVNDRIFKYNRGLYKYKGMQIYVSQGSGTFGPPMRLGTSSEITLITLEPAI
jgi:predicted MPP superfamily phosphohydrolase